MSENSAQFIAILVTIAGLLGWLMKTVIGYFVKSSNEKKNYIEHLVDINQKNTESFTNTINHQRTLDREMQQKNTGMIIEAISGLKSEMSTTNRINSELIGILKDRSK